MWKRDYAVELCHKEADGLFGCATAHVRVYGFAVESEP